MAVEAIGLVAGLLGILSFGLNNFGSQEETGSKVRLAVGLDTDGGLSNAGGSLPDVRLFNEAGQFLGMSADPGDIGSGEQKDYTVEHDTSTQQATYTLFSANDDAICIAFASITWPNGDKYAWIGDWGKECGGSWFFSNYYIQGTNHKPNCLWIDADGDQPQTGFQIHWPEFVNRKGDSIPADDEGKKEKADYLCNAGPPFTLYEDEDPSSINYWTPNNTASATAYDIAYGQPRTRSASAKFRNAPASKKPRKEPKVISHLVMDDHTERTATELCSSESSYGPDYASLAENKFCSMKDKKLYNFCDDEVVENCFDKEKQRLMTPGVDARSPSPYSGVVDWTGN